VREFGHCYSPYVWFLPLSRNSFDVRLAQFDPIAEWIVDMTPIAAFDRLVCRDFVTSLLCFRHHAGKVIDNESRMGFAPR
jgi:hypothetical protein